ncbi:MAG: MFS transporter [Candidatus Bathyarchaeia archaeon]
MEKPRSERREWGIGILRGNLLWLVICRCIWMFTTSIPRPYLSLYIRTLGGTPESIGIVNSLASIAGLFLYPLGGYIADSRGRVRLVGGVTFLYAISFIPFAFAPNWQTLALANFFQNLVLFYAPILTVIEADSIPPGQRGTGFALALAVPGALGIISPYIGGYLIDAMGVIEANRLIYLVGFAAGILVASIRMFKLKETLETTKEIPSVRNIPLLLKESYLSFIDTMKWMPRPLKVLAIFQIIQIFFNDVASPFWILYASDFIGISASEWGLLSLISGSIRVMVALPAGRLIDKHGRRKLLVPLMLLTPFMPLAFLRARGFWDLAALVVVMGAVNAFLMPGFQSLVADYTPRSYRGRVTSAIGGGQFFVDIRGARMGGGMLLFIPASLALYLGGVLYSLSSQLPFQVMSIGMGLAAIWAMLEIREPETLQE